MTLKGKKILIGITAGISAYKVCELIRIFKRQNADVTVMMTPSAKKLVTPLTLMTLSQNMVYSDQFEIKEWKPEHIDLADEADIFVIAPATANTISKIANGVCDNLLTTTVCAFEKPIVLAPAMNERMWNNKIFQSNLKKLKDYNFIIIEPEVGFLACQAEGKGRMAEPEAIAQKTVEVLSEKK